MKGLNTMGYLPLVQDGANQLCFDGIFQSVDFNKLWLTAGLHFLSLSNQGQSFY
jgi:hypothetical protein